MKIKCYFYFGKKIDVMKQFSEFFKTHGVEIVQNAFGLENFYILKIKNKIHIGKHIKNSERICLSATKDAYEKLLQVNCSIIISINHVFNIGEQIFIIMECVDNYATLNKYMKEAYFKKVDYKMKELKLIFFNIAKSIDEMHLHGLIHADITGSNLLVNKNFEVKIIDFDFAIINHNNCIQKSIDILKYNSLIFEFIFEQMYLNEKYNLFSDVDTEEKKEHFSKIASQHKTFNSCLDVFSNIFGEI